MGDFFRPRRKKIGLVSLITACVLMGFWVRSFSVVDVLTCPVAIHLTWLGFPEAESEYYPAFVSLRGGFTFGLVDRKSIFTSGKASIGIWFRYPDPDGSQFAEHPRIPYWLSVIPLTLLSGWLLLIKSSSATEETLAHGKGI